MTGAFQSPRGVAALAAFAMTAALAPLDGAAQYERTPSSAAYALQDVTLIHGDGTVSDGVTVVVRNGLVEALGAGVEPPPDAEILEGEDLHVHPGFVDPYGAATMDLPQADTDGAQPWAPSRELQRFTPRRTAQDHLDATGPDLATQRENGVVASAAFPGDGMMPGQGATLMHRVDAGEPRDLVVDSPIGVSMALQGAPGMYPTTTFGVVAHLRQAFLDAKHRAVAGEAFEADPQGMAPPARDADYEVLRQMANGEMRTFVRADGAEGIRRILSLSDELGLDPVLVGAEEAWRVADELAERDMPVVVSLDFPEPDEWDPEAGDGDLDPSAQRERQELEDIYSNAGRLEDAGVRLAFTSGGSGSTDMRAGMLKAVEYGLSEDAALSGLTTEPADLIGVPHLSQVAEGGGATFVVTHGDPFQEDSDIVFTFVEGQPERVAAPDEGLEETDEPPADLAGTWSVEIRFGPQGDDGTLEIEQDGDRFTGTLEGAMGESEIRDGQIAGDSFLFEVIPEGAPQGFSLEMQGEVDGDELTASGEGPEGMGTVEVRGTREPGAARTNSRLEEGGNR